MKRAMFVLSMVVWILFMLSCSGEKYRLATSDVVGLYEGINEYSAWTFMLYESGAGYESAYFQNYELAILIPFTWTLEHNSLTLTYEKEETLIKGNTEEESVEAIITAILSEYSGSRTCTLKKVAETIVIKGNDLYPTCVKNDEIRRSPNHDFGAELYHTDVKNDEMLEEKEKINKKDIRPIVVYKDNQRHCSYFIRSLQENTLYKCDLLTNEVVSIDLNEIKCVNEREPIIINSVREIVVKDDQLIIVAYNGGCGMFAGEFLIVYNTFNETFNYIDFGFVDLINDNTQAKVSHRKLIKEGSCSAENEYEYSDVIHEL